MSEIEFLNWVRGPGFQIATIIFVAGVIIRFAEILLLGRKTNLAEAKGSEMRSGLRTIVTRSLPHLSTFNVYYYCRLHLSYRFVCNNIFICTAYTDV